MQYQLIKTLNLKWQIKDKTHYKWSDCKVLINTKTGRVIKKTLNAGCIGYWIGKDFIALSKLKDRIELIPKSDCPF